MCLRFLKKIKLLRFMFFAFIPWPQFYATQGPKLQDGASLTVSLASQCPQAKVPFTATIAHSDLTRQKGLSERHKKLAPLEGMIFVFDAPIPASFWMKRTFIPLQLIFIDPMGIAIDAYEMPVEKDPNNPKHFYGARAPITAALEFAPRTIKNPLGQVLCVETSDSK